MIDWIISTVPAFKIVHIAALTIWCGGLLALPLMLSRHDKAVGQAEYRTIVWAAHLTYTVCVTPAAVIAVIAGTWLIFLREVFTPWLFAKLAFVVFLVVAHAWIGHILAQVLEAPKKSNPPWPHLPIAAVMAPMIAVLYLVLAKPSMGWLTFPSWFLEPQGGQLLFDVPSR